MRQGVSDYARMWRPMHNTQGAAWALSDLLPPPFDLRLTDTLGRSTVAECVHASGTIMALQGP